MKATICFILVSLSISLAVVRSQEKNASSVVQASLAVAPEGKADSGGEQESRRDAEELYEKAIQLRSLNNPTKNDLKTAVHLLYAAAGVVHLSLNTSRPGVDLNDGVTYGQGVEEGRTAYKKEYLFTADDVELKWRDGKIHHTDAVRELVYVFREGKGAPYNPAISHRLVKELAGIGVAEFQADLGSFYSLGLEPVAKNKDGLVFILQEPRHDLAMLYLTFAAKSGDPLGKMALGYRYLHGIGVEKSCSSAILYYEPVASSVLEAAQIDGGLPLVSIRRLIHRSTKPSTMPTEEQEYFHYKWFADYGHAEAARAVAHLLTHRADQDLAGAIEYLRQAANMGDADSMAHLGHAYANGIAVHQNNATARKWFNKAAEQGNPSGLLGLGIMHLTGQGAEVDYTLAAKYFKRSMEMSQDWTGIGDAYFYSGLMQLHGWGLTKNLKNAASMFSIASKRGNLLASYNLAIMHIQGHTDQQGDRCKQAAILLKQVAERGWATLAEAEGDYDGGDHEWALYNYLKIADVGVELAQSNAAWMLQQGYGYTGPRQHAMSTQMLRASAGQGNQQALVPLGDAYWYGHGVGINWEKAGKAYNAAAKNNIAQALFNLGYMYQYGLGVPQDLHIAKRFFDRCRQSSTKAYLPTVLALFWLRVHSSWEGMKPSLPQNIVSFVAPVFEHNPSVATPSLRWIGKLQFSTKSIMSAKIFDMVEDSIENSLVVWLAGLLGLILWRRHARRMRQVNPRDAEEPAAVVRNNPDADNNDAMETHLPSNPSNRHAQSDEAPSNDRQDDDDISQSTAADLTSSTQGAANDDEDPNET